MPDQVDGEDKVMLNMPPIPTEADRRKLEALLRAESERQKGIGK